MRQIVVIDSHTGGEPTRVVLEGGPDLGTGSVAERLQRFQLEHDADRSAIVKEPRGSDVLVGALLVEPIDPDCVAGAIFFNNVGYLGMCGHGTIGLVETLSYLGRIKPGLHRVETSVGVITARLHDDGQVSFENVPSYRKAQSVTVPVEGMGEVTGDVAWGGNWFFLVKDHGLRLELDEAEALTQATWKMRQAINAHGFPEVDHVELFGPAADSINQSRNFVLCPGKAYDRSPCGTGTSAKIACLASDGELKPGEVWRQESIIGSVFEASYRLEGDKIIPAIKGRAYVTMESSLIINNDDPFSSGIKPGTQSV